MAHYHVIWINYWRSHFPSCEETISKAPKLTDCMATKSTLHAVDKFFSLLLNHFVCSKFVSSNSLVYKILTGSITDQTTKKSVRCDNTAETLFCILRSVACMNHIKITISQIDIQVCLVWSTPIQSMIKMSFAWHSLWTYTMTHRHNITAQLNFIHRFSSFSDYTLIGIQHSKRLFVRKEMF